MRKGFFRISKLVVLLMIALTLFTCSLFDNGVQFMNKSSYIVAVIPLEQDWESFQLDPGDTKKITTKNDYVSFLYTPATLVDCDKSKTGKIIFTNK